MKIELQRIKIREIVDGYVDSDTEGCRGLGGRLDIRPKYQRNFVYDAAKREAVIHSVRHNFPLSVMYWVKKGEGTDEDPIRYEVLDGQQRTISICQFVDGAFPVKSDNGNPQFFSTLDNTPGGAQDKFLDYELMVYICEGTEEEELEWFQVINIAGEELTKQELRNAIYSGEWLTDAKRYFSRINGGGKRDADPFMNAKWNRQEVLEKAIDWVSHGDIEGYMSKHRRDEDASELVKGFKAIISWVKRVFPTYRKEMKRVPWGPLYNKYAKKFGSADADRLEEQVSRLMADEDVTNKAGVYSYVLGEPERSLSIRKFTDRQKREAYERQHHRCPMCEAEGKDVEYAIGEMDGDHIVPWSKGGTTTTDNLQMLCKKHNQKKSNDADVPNEQRKRQTSDPVDPLAGRTPVDTRVM